MKIAVLFHFGPNGAVHVTSDPANAKNGKSALEFDYEITGTGMTLAALPLPTTSLAGMRALRFWLKTDASTGICGGLERENAWRRQLFGGHLVSQTYLAAD